MLKFGEMASIAMDFTSDWSKGEYYNDLTYCHKEFKGHAEMADFNSDGTL